MLPKSTSNLRKAQGTVDTSRHTLSSAASKRGANVDDQVARASHRSTKPQDEIQAVPLTEEPLTESTPWREDLFPPLENRKTILLDCGNRVWAHARAHLPTAFGAFDIVAFRTSGDDSEHVALLRGRPSAEEIVPVRIHSECLTGDVLSSLRCDCQAQLRTAQAELGRSQLGVLIYMRQEGRGIGLANKISAYALQDEGLDTVEANLHLGFDDDLRTYDVAAAMLRILGIERVALFTNNPRKVFGLTGQGIEVAEMCPIRVGATAENASYLATKRDKSGHLL